MRAILSQWIGVAKSAKTPVSVTTDVSGDLKPKIKTAKDASFIGVMMKLLGVKAEDSSAQEKPSGLDLTTAKDNKGETASKSKQEVLKGFSQMVSSANVILNRQTSSTTNKELDNLPSSGTVISPARTENPLAVQTQAKDKTNAAQQPDGLQNSTGKNTANSRPALTDGDELQKNGEIPHLIMDKSTKSQEDVISISGKNMMSKKDSNVEEIPVANLNDVPPNYKKGDTNALRKGSVTKLSQNRAETSGPKKNEGSSSPLKLLKSDGSQKKLHQDASKSGNPLVTLKKENIITLQSGVKEASKQQRNNIRSAGMTKKASVFLGDDRLTAVSALSTSRSAIKQDFTLFKSISTPTNATASPVNPMEMDSDTSKEFKDDSNQQLKETHLNNLKTPQFAEVAGQKLFGKELAQIGRQHISQGQKASQQTSSHWKHHRFVLKDGKTIHIAARSSDGSLQLQLNAGNGELGKMLHQHLHEIQQHVQQQLNIEIDLQLQDFGGRQPNHESDTASPNQLKNGSKMNGNVPAIRANHPSGTQQIRYFGFNRNEWTA